MCFTNNNNPSSSLLLFFFFFYYLFMSYLHVDHFSADILGL